MHNSQLSVKVIQLPKEIEWSEGYTNTWMYAFVTQTILIGIHPLLEPNKISFLQSHLSVLSPFWSLVSLVKSGINHNPDVNPCLVCDGNVYINEISTEPMNLYWSSDTSYSHVPIFETWWLHGRYLSWN